VEVWVAGAPMQEHLGDICSFSPDTPSIVCLKVDGGVPKSVYPMFIFSNQ
jgi:hypothetical protein